MFVLELFEVVLVFLLSLSQLQKITFFGLHIYFSDFFIALFLIYAQYKYHWWQKLLLVCKKNSEQNKKIAISGLLIILISWVQAAIHHNLDLTPFLQLLRLVVYLCFVVVYKKIHPSPKRLWLHIILIIAALGLLQYLLLPDLRFLTWAGYDDHFYRLASTLLDPNFAGLIFVFGLNYYFLQKRMHWLSILLLLIAAYLTYSRAAYLSLLFSSLYIFLQDKKRYLILIILLIFFASLPLLPTHSGGDGVNLARTASVNARLSKDLSILQKSQGINHLLGRGFLVSEKETGFPNNFFVLVWNNLGLFGLIWLLVVAKNSYKKLSMLQKTLLISLLTFSMFNHSITQATTILVGLGLFFIPDYKRNSTSTLSSV